MRKPTVLEIQRNQLRNPSQPRTMLLLCRDGERRCAAHSDNCRGTTRDQVGFKCCGEAPPYCRFRVNGSRDSMRASFSGSDCCTRFRSAFPARSRSGTAKGVY